MLFRSAFTLCTSTPHGAAVFRNPQWPFTTKLTAPKVALESLPIAQRHVNALALSEYLSSQEANPTQLNCQWFFEGSEGSPTPRSTLFADWCRGPDAESKVRMAQGVPHVARGTPLAGIPVAAVLNRTAEAVQALESEWKRELDVLLTQYRQISSLDVSDAADSGNEAKNPAEKAVARMTHRLRREYLLRELTERGFLPGYGFPTQLGAFVYTTQYDLQIGRAHV